MMRAYTLVPLLLALCYQPLMADEAADRWKHFYEGIAKQYSIETVDDNPTPLKLSTYPALLWSNPARPGDTNGAFWVWTLDGRPQAVGTIFSYQMNSSGRVLAHEFHSLSQSALLAKLNDKTVWTPAKQGIKWNPLSGVPAPDSTRQRRLIQMRAIVRQVSATAENEFDQATGEQQMRLLPSPLYRYETGENDVDGALFTFVIGTDPECLLMVESNPIEKSWSIAVARFTHMSFKVSHNGTKLFEHVRGTEPENDTSFRYVCFRNGRAPLKPPAIDEIGPE